MRTLAPRPSLWLVPALFAWLVLLWPVLGLPVPGWDPVLARVVWDPEPGQVTMGWYGRSILALALAALAGWAVDRWARSHAHWSRDAVWWASALAIGAAMGLLAWRELAHWSSLAH